MDPFGVSVRSLVTRCLVALQARAQNDLCLSPASSRRHRRSSMKKALVFSFVTTLAGASILVGCSANPDGSYGAPAESAETTSEALGSCYGASCSGKDP